MFRSSTIIRELALNLAKVIFTLKHSVKLRRYLLCGCVAAHVMEWRVCCRLCRMHSVQHTQVQCKLPDDGGRPKHVGARFMCILM
jgi:hypothetical protein